MSAAADPAPDPAPTSARAERLVAALLFVGTLAVFWSATHLGFIAYDDPLYVTDNPHVRGGLSLASVQWAFSNTYAVNYHPVTWLSHLLDFTLWGTNAARHHATSVVLHALNAALCFLVLRRLGLLPVLAAAGALSFAIHPQRVESVVWIAERKDVLSGLFFFVALLSWSWFARGGGRVAYACTLAAFVAGLLAKPMLVTLPALLLVLDATVLGRTASRLRLVGEKVPFFVAALAVAAVTVWAQERAIASLEKISFAQRLGGALHGTRMYLLQYVWPFGISPYYPRYPAHLEPAQLLVSAVVVLGVVSVVIVAWRRGWPLVVCGGLWFFGLLVPVIGLVQVGTQAHADRYTYLPAIGLSLMVAGLAQAMQPRPMRIIALGWATWTALFLPLTVSTIGQWRDNETLFRFALAQDPENPDAHEMVANALLERRDAAAALPHAVRAYRAQPSLDRTLLLAEVLLQLQRPAEAAPLLADALRFDPRSSEALRLKADLDRLRGPGAQPVP